MTTKGFQNLLKVTSRVFQGNNSSLHQREIMTKETKNNCFMALVGRLNFWIKPLNINYQSGSRKHELYCVLAQLNGQSI